MATTATPKTNTAAATRKAAAAKRSTTAKKAAQTRSANQAATARKRTAAAKKAAATRAELAKTPVDRVQEYAERIVLAQVGATLVARDAVVEAVDGLRGSLASRQKAEKELQLRRRRIEAEIKRFERRGSTARTRFEREVKTLRTDLNKQVTATRKDVTAQTDLVTSRVENFVQTGLTAGQQVATKVQERIAAIA